MDTEDYAMLVIGGLLALAFAGCLGCKVAADVSGHTNEVAQKEADAFIREMGIKGKARCADTDSDGDGYVSCPMVLSDGRVEPLECAGSFNWNTGCRPPKAVVQSR